MKTIHDPCIHGDPGMCDECYQGSTLQRRMTNMKFDNQRIMEDLHNMKTRKGCDHNQSHNREGFCDVHGTEMKPQHADASSASHTPTPWTFNESMRDIKPTGEAIWLEDKNKNINLLLRAYCGRIEQARKDAAFIVKAVNCHEEMLDALEMCLDNFGGDMQSLFRIRLKEIIAKAEGL